MASWKLWNLHFIAQGNQVQHRFIQTDTLQKISNDFNFTERLQMPSNQVLLRKFTKISFAEPVFSVSSLLRITPASLICGLRARSKCKGHSLVAFVIGWRFEYAKLHFLVSIIMQS